MSKEQWNSRYASDSYIYGTRPNAFLKSFLDHHTPGSILLPAEGEGRNAVYAAQLKWKTDAFDQSEAGRHKAMLLALKNRVEIDYAISSLEDWKPVPGKYDCVALIFVHMPPALRISFHSKAMDSLKPGGYLVLQGFTKRQLAYDSGGPKDPAMLFDSEELQADFQGLDLISLEETQEILDEGHLHKGMAEVVKLLARKPL